MQNLHNNQRVKTMKYVIIYRQSNELNLDTKIFGPYDSFDEAYDELCKLPACGSVDIESITPNSGVKYIEPVYESVSKYALSLL